LRKGLDRRLGDLPVGLSGVYWFRKSGRDAGSRPSSQRWPYEFCEMRGPTENPEPGYRGAYHRARTSATRWHNRLLHVHFRFNCQTAAPVLTPSLQARRTSTGTASGECEQARAEQHKAGGGYREESIGYEVMMAHGTYTCRVRGVPIGYPVKKIARGRGNWNPTDALEQQRPV
jgi:hypothetical protein